jgi:hypothetical protein
MTLATSAQEFVQLAPMVVLAWMNADEPGQMFADDAAPAITLPCSWTLAFIPTATAAKKKRILVVHTILSLLDLN